jgi:hypothetical protein
VAERPVVLPPEFAGCVMLKIRAYNAAAAINVADYAERALRLRRGTIDRMTATRAAVAHSRVLMASIDTLVAELTSELTRKGWLWPAHRTLESPSQWRSSAQETRVRAETMRDATAAGGNNVTHEFSAGGSAPALAVQMYWEILVDDTEDGYVSAYAEPYGLYVNQFGHTFYWYVLEDADDDKDAIEVAEGRASSLVAAMAAAEAAARKQR